MPTKTTKPEPCPICSALIKPGYICRTRGCPGKLKPIPQFPGEPGAPATTLRALELILAAEIGIPLDLHDLAGATRFAMEFTPAFTARLSQWARPFKKGTRIRVAGRAWDGIAFGVALDRGGRVFSWFELSQSPCDGAPPKERFTITEYSPGLEVKRAPMIPRDIASAPDASDDSEVELEAWVYGRGEAILTFKLLPWKTL